MAKSFRPDPVLVKGVGLAVTSGEPYLKPGFAYTGFPATAQAAQSAYEQSGMTVKDIDLVECHDCFTITEILNIEDLGLAKKGEGWRYVEEGRAAIGGEIPVNPSGGLKSFGHPIGATGIRMIYEVSQHLWNKAGARQVKNAEVGLAHNLGGPGFGWLCDDPGEQIAVSFQRSAESLYERVGMRYCPPSLFFR